MFGRGKKKEVDETIGIGPEDGHKKRKEKLTMFASWYAPGEYSNNGSTESSATSTDTNVGDRRHEGLEDFSNASFGSTDDRSNNRSQSPYGFVRHQASASYRSATEGFRSVRAQQRKVVKYAMYLERYIFVTCWLVMLALGLVVSKLWCRLGLPKECAAEFVTPPSMERLQALFLYGLVMSWMCGISVQPRFWSLFCWKRWWFFLFYAASSPLFALLLEDDTKVSVNCCDSKSIATISVLSFLAIVSITWHIYYAFRMHRTDEAIVYTVSRFIFVVFYLTTFALVQSNILPESYAIEPYIISFVLSLFCQFDHWLSITLLSIFLGMFVQSLTTADLSSGLFTSIENCDVVDAVRMFSQFAATLSSGGTGSFAANVCIVNQDGSPQLQSPEGLVVNY
uniref:Uncharacterized protein n=1 Tax=Aplanochytrium stocchinoi TaxID=215587 RepID=A0A7S3PGC6_9STRA|mmetsp:Transcript_5172/g.6526  ORF Transcript_5172/g.6526 Transcript_5172/m.6526 type:complete len:396 (+) Transcript_5172:174-1361(+)